jgi:chromosome segregation ATPase
VFLRRVTVTGFKSFANKTVLELAPGLTAIVGPNGSGKSNIADAIRWAFGEQSRSRLRLDERQDIIYAGSDARARASVAEVTLLFDNEDGAFPLELSEVEITRRLYRSGESDYLLAGRSIRQSDLQTLLAHAGLGVGSYAVIGQGMIDTLLLSSPAERKLLFDEAAGIRAPELKRQEATRKLEQTSANLVRLRDIATEIEPHLALLERSAKSAETGRKLTDDLAAIKIELAQANLARQLRLRDELSRNLAALNAQDVNAAKGVHELELAVEEAKSAVTKRQQAFDELKADIAKLEQVRDRQALELANLRSAQAAAQGSKDLAETLSSQKTTIVSQLADSQARNVELNQELKATASAALRAQSAVDKASISVEQAQAQLVAIRNSAEDGTRDQYVDHALQILKTLAISLQAQELTIEDVRLLVHKAGRLLSHASRVGGPDLLTELKDAQKLLESAMTKRETAIEHLTNVTITSRSLEIDQAHQEAEVARMTAELVATEARLKDLAAAGDASELTKKVMAAEKHLALSSEQLEVARSKRQSLDSAMVGVEADLAVRLERARVAHGEMVSRQEHIRDELVVLKASIPLAERTLGSLGGEPNPEVDSSEGRLRDLDNKVVAAHAELEAHSSLEQGRQGEYEEVKTRHSELTSQIGDLESAKSDLEQIIGSLDELIKDRFKQNFEQLSTYFGDYFARLFNGGRAALSLVRNPDGDYGIAIQASPNGKRLSSVGSLSGGERAMAGTALIAAIMRTSSSPFVVLDEIDAALDESNSTRLAEILAELHAHSQLVVITHNRQTMRAAGVIFGVTTDSRHASRIISMRLEDADKLAAR